MDAAYSSLLFDRRKVGDGGGRKCGAGEVEVDALEGVGDGVLKPV